MDTTRLVQTFIRHLPEFVKKRLTTKEQTYFYASITNISSMNQDNFIYDTEGYLLLMPTAQSNLSLFNISCDSLIFQDHHPFRSFHSSIKHSTSSIDLHTNLKKSFHHSSIDFTEDIFQAKTNNLQRWHGLDLLNTSA